MMAANFGQKTLSVWNQLICQSQYCLKQKNKVLCVFIANYGVNNEKSEKHSLPGVLKMLTMEKSQKPKLTISVRQLLFIINLHYSTLDNDIIHYQ